MTPEEVVIMISLGTLMAHPLKSKETLISIYGGALLIAGLLFFSYLQIYFPKTKRWLMGEPIVIIKNGKIIHQNLIRARMTVDELKMRLRIKKVNDILKVKLATMEINGDLGIELDYQNLYATKADIDELKHAINLICNRLDIPQRFSYLQLQKQKNENDLFIQAENVQNNDPLQ